MSVAADHLPTEPIAGKPTDTARRLSARDAAVSCALYVSVFAVLAWPWLAAADHAVPFNRIGHQADERVVAWILAWVTHALVTAPWHLMDANINYPAPGQLAGIEHFLSAQLLFAPAYWLTGNAVLSANIAVLLTYPFGALAMQCLLVALGCRRSIAWVGGLVFALGPLRVPGNLMTLKYVNLHLALVALALTRLREDPRFGAALFLSIAMTLALLSSYYLAVMVSVMGAVWCAVEWLRREPGRGRFATLALVATAASLVPFVLVSLPYLRHADAPGTGLPTTAINRVANDLALGSYRATPPVIAALALPGLALLWSTATAGRVARLGAPMALVAGLLMLGPTVDVGSWQVPMPFRLFAHTPLRFFQAPSRFAVVFGLGTTLLAVATLEGVRHRFGRRGGNLAALATVAAVLATMGSRLPGAELDRIEAQNHPIYPAIAAVTAREGGGPLLDLPFISVVAALKSPILHFGSEADAMVGSTRHWLPLITGFTSHPPPHRTYLDTRIRRLPADDAFDDLIDMTHLRWVLLRPPVQWPADETKTRNALRHSPRLAHVLNLFGWDLLRVVGEPRHPEWFAAIAAGTAADHTPFGTPLRPIPETAARAEVRAESRIPPALYAGALVTLDVRVWNRGDAAWPVLIPRSGPETHTVRLLARWWIADRPRGQDGPVSSEDIPIPRDIAPGEDIKSRVYLKVPKQVGWHDLEIGVVQVEGARFQSAGNAPLRARIELRAPESPP